MQFKAKPGAVVNRWGKRYVADIDGLIIADSKESQEAFKAYGFKDLTIKKTKDEGKEKRS